MDSTENKISFEQLPEAVSTLLERVEALTSLIQTRFATSENSVTAEEWMDMEQLCAYLPDHPSRNTVYGWVCQRQIPHHKTTKKLSFKRSEIDQWLSNSRRATAAELKAQALTTYGTKKGGRL